MITATNIHSQLARFAECVYEAADIIGIRRLPSGRSTWHVAAELPELLAQLKADNVNGQGVHVGINPRTRRGGTKTVDVRLARCLFADFDRTTPEQARERWESAGLPEPTLTVKSGHGVHAYWRLEEPVGSETWTRFQRDLAAVLKSDPSVHDPPRLARLPGFVNHKEPVADCIILDADPPRTYELAELHEHIPERPVPAPTTNTEEGRRTATLLRLVLLPKGQKLTHDSSYGRGGGHNTPPPPSWESGGTASHPETTRATGHPEKEPRAARIERERMVAIREERETKEREEQKNPELPGAITSVA